MAAPEHAAAARAEAGQAGADAVVLVIPAFQEAATIADVVRRARAVVPGAPVLVVDDGSADQTAALARDAGAVVLPSDPGGRNRGKGIALRRGLAAALARGAARVVTLDGDGQHRPEDVPLLLALAERCPGRIVIGSRRAQSGVPAVRRRANRVADFWISWAAGHFVPDTQSGLRVYPAEVLAELGRYRDAMPGFVFESALLIDAARRGCPSVAVEITALYGAALSRQSHFHPVRDVTRIVLMVGGRLLQRGLSPAGLWRSLAERRAAERRLRPGRH